uniref:Uncharacterized protein n=1 Tax=Arundo donax TaxID=35708 RepID=A0A0A9HBE0_ARUDO
MASSLMNSARFSTDPLVVLKLSLFCC